MTAPAEPAEPTLSQLPAEPMLRSWTCPERWLRRPLPGVIDDLGEPFHSCEPPNPPRLRFGDSVTPLQEGEQDGERPICDPAADGSYPLLGLAVCQPLGDPCPSLEEVVVENTESSAYDGRFGRGLHVEGGGEVSVVDSQFLNNRDLGVAIFDGTK